MNPLPAQVVDLAALATQASADDRAGAGARGEAESAVERSSRHPQATAAVGAVWSLASADLNLNLLHFAAGDGVEAHVNREVDVIGLVVAGEGILELEDRQERLRPGLLFFIPKGTRRAIRSSSADFAYLSCHRRRAGLMPTRASRERHA